MESKDTRNEIFTIILASLILALTVSFKNTAGIYYAGISFLIIISANVATKKIVGYFLETDVQTKFWSWYRFGFRKDSHFKSPVPMAWLPLLLALFTKGFFWWLAILEFDVKAKSERVSRRHGLYRFTEVTEWHMAWIATWGLIINAALAIVAYLAGFELFTKLSMYYIVWSLVPLSKLDGSRIFFASRAMWITIVTIALIILGWMLTVI